MKIRAWVYRGFLVAAVFGVITAPAWESPVVLPGKFRRLAELADAEINESSGLAISHRDPNVFWTHNDSGDGPRIFAFDKTGKRLGTCELDGARAIDWEGMASFERGGKNWLLVADVGDNGLDRPYCTLYLCEEPSSDARHVAASSMEFRFEDGPRNCESVAVDPIEGKIFLAAKLFSTQCKIYELPLPEKTSSEMLVARAFATVPVPLATAMDISPDRRRAIFLTYTNAFQFERDDRESWQQAFAKPPTQLAMPIRRQGESICYAQDGRTLFLTSEKSPSPLWEVLPHEAEKQPISGESKK